MGMDFFRQLFKKGDSGSPTNMIKLVDSQKLTIPREDMAKSIVKEYRDILYELYGSATKVDRLLIFMDKNNNASILQVSDVNSINNFDGAIVRCDENVGVKGISLCGKDKTDKRLLQIYNAAMDELKKARESIENDFLDDKTKNEIKARIECLENKDEKYLINQLDKNKEREDLLYEQQKSELSRKDKNILRLEQIKDEMNDNLARTCDIMLKLYARRQPAYKTNKQEVDEGIKSLVLLKDGTIVLDLKDQGHEEGRTLDIFKDGIKITRKEKDLMPLKVNREFFEDETLDRHGILRMQVMKEAVKRFKKYLEANPRKDEEITGVNKSNNHKYKRVRT